MAAKLGASWVELIKPTGSCFWDGATLEGLCDPSAGWEVKELTFCIGGTDLFLVLGTWRTMWKGKRWALVSLALLPAVRSRLFVRLFVFLPPHSFPSPVVK